MLPGPGCGGNLSVFAVRKGVFTDPGNHSGPMTCFWYISFPWGHVLDWSLQGTEIHRAPDDCDNDYVAVYQGLGDTGEILQRDCPPVRILFLMCVLLEPIILLCVFYCWSPVSILLCVGM